MTHAHCSALIQEIPVWFFIKPAVVVQQAARAGPSAPGTEHKKYSESQGANILNKKN